MLTKTQIRTRKIEPEEALVHIDGFEPMPHSAFPDMMKQVLLKAADPTDHHQAVQGKAASPNAVLIKNAITLFECFFHFDAVQDIIGRYNLFALVGKACGLLDSDNFVVLQQCVGSIIQTLSDARLPLMPMEDSKAVTDCGTQDHDTLDLIGLVDTYLEFEAHEPSEVVENWCDNETVKALWAEWMTKVEMRIMNVTDGSTETGKNNLIIRADVC